MPSHDGSASGAPILEEFLQLDPENVPPAVGDLLAVFREPVDSYEQGDEPISRSGRHGHLTEIMTRQQQPSGRSSCPRSGAYKDLTERLTLEVAERASRTQPPRSRRPDSNGRIC